MKLKIKEEKKEAVFWLEEEDGDIVLKMEKKDGSDTKDYIIVVIKDNDIIEAFGNTTFKWDLSGLDSDEVDQEVDD